MKNSNNESRANKNNYDKQKFVIELTFPKDAGNEKNTLNEILQKICHDNFKGSEPYRDIRTVVYDNSVEVNNKDDTTYETGLNIYFDEMDRHERYDTACRLFSALKEMFSNKQFVEMLSAEKPYHKCPVVIPPEFDTESVIYSLVGRMPIWCPIISDEEEKALIENGACPSLRSCSLWARGVYRDCDGEYVALVEVAPNTGVPLLDSMTKQMLTHGFLEIRVAKTPDPIYDGYNMYAVMAVNKSGIKNSGKIDNDIYNDPEYQKYIALVNGESDK